MDVVHQLLLDQRVGHLQGKGAGGVRRGAQPGPPPLKRRNSSEQLGKSHAQQVKSGHPGPGQNTSGRAAAPPISSPPPHTHTSGASLEEGPGVLPAGGGSSKESGKGPWVKPERGRIHRDQRTSEGRPNRGGAQPCLHMALAESPPLHTSELLLGGYCSHIPPESTRAESQDSAQPSRRHLLGETCSGFEAATGCPSLPPPSPALPVLPG